MSSSGTTPLLPSVRMILTPTHPPSEPTGYWIGLGAIPCPPMPTGASIGKDIVPVPAVNTPSPVHVTVISTGFHSFRDSSQGISVLMQYRLSGMNKKSLRDVVDGSGLSCERVVYTENYLAILRYALTCSYICIQVPCLQRPRRCDPPLFFRIIIKIDIFIFYN